MNEIVKNKNTQWRAGGGYFEGDWPEPLHKDLNHFVEYWRSKKPSPDGIPKRADIHPRDMINYLPGIVIIKRVIENGKKRYIYALAGSDSAMASGMDITGKYVDEIFNELDRSAAFDTFEKILSSGKPHFIARPSPVPDRDFTKYERIIAPLLDKNGEPNILIGLWVWDWVSRPHTL